MSLTQLSMGIVAAVFSLTTIGSELMMANDRPKDDKRVENKADAGKDKARKDEKQSPWETRQMIPSGPKF